MRCSRHTTIALAFGTFSFLNAQVNVDAEIILQGSTEGDRQVLGLSPSIIGTDALQAGVEQDGTHVLATSTTNDWNVQVSGLIGPPVPGTQLMIRTPVSTPGSIVLMVNNSGPYPLLYGPDQPVTGVEIPGSAMLSVVFDGNGFQIMNGPVNHLRTCPSGTVEVNEQYCISTELFPGNSLTFFDAIQACDSVGQRLCSWGEWYNACTVQSQLGISGMTATWEWTNDSSNEDGHARWAGYQSCIARGNGPVLIPAKFRCCYSR